MSETLVIFDFDGVIVDSEILFNDLLAEKLSKLSSAISSQECIRLFSGMSWEGVEAHIEKAFSLSLPFNFRKKLNQDFSDRISTHLKPIPYIEEVLTSLPYKCIASNGDLDRIFRSLEVTNLFKHFKKEEVFNRQMVKKGKPDPSLFLLAAEKMGAKPADCLVIEDSLCGIRAAHAAKMKVIGFTGGSHAKSSDYIEKVEQTKPLFITDDIREITQTPLPYFLAQVPFFNI